MASPLFLLACSTAHLVAPPEIPRPRPLKGPSPAIREAVLRAYMEEEAGSWEAVDAEFSKGSAAASCDPWLEKAWGSSAWRMGETEEAVKHWDQAILCFGLEEDGERAEIARLIRAAKKRGEEGP